MDAKEIGFAAKDILIGIGTAVAGAKGGPEAAKGVGKAGDGIDRILGNVMPGDKKPTREERFDRGDFGARPQLTPPQEPPAANAATSHEEPPRKAETPSGQNLGDAKIVLEHLKSLGWTDEKAQQILGGPESTSLAAVVRKEGEAIRAAPGRSHPKTSGFRQDPVEGVRVPEGAQKA
jgi:hypothetical protein